jgi:hypothetical protein
MNGGQQIRDVHETGANPLMFAVGNAAVALFFATLWVAQYHMNPNLSDSIDFFVVPWLWIGCFFMVTYFIFRRSFSRKKRVALCTACALGFSFLLWFLIMIALVPMFDPMW